MKSIVIPIFWLFSDFRQAILLFRAEWHFWYSYDGYEYTLPYTEISHHHCCSAGLANPRGSENGVVIFANQGDQRYLVMIGEF